MDKPYLLSCSTLKPDLPGRLTMLRSRSLHRLVSCALLLLVSLSSSGESRPHQISTPDVDRADSQRVLLLEAVKTGILGSLGMDREPRPTQKASEEELSKMYQLYREKVREMRGNSSQPMRETLQSTTSTVLFPATVEPIVRRGEHSHPHSGQRMQWYRAVFHKNPNIQTELTLARAKLKISRKILEKPTTVQPEARRREIKVKINRMKPINSAAWTHIISANVSRTQDVMLDIIPEVERWMRTDGSEALVVDVGMVVGEKDALEANQTISLELSLTQTKPARKTRLPRSNKEDVCDERGWCCRKSVTVSFKDIGWTDWVVAPTEYIMHFCDGTCPHNYKPASMHTQVKSRLHQITKGVSPRPCCVPAAYEPMVLMHSDSRGKLKLTSFDDLIVSKCHCA
ncbi:growth/differentiation factor 15 [Cottoperca gobio]|uniref:Growth/differentiation factor 15 n=1 Tax=Cottoperca gobio TaxID=56716 RepID=A0A6J2RK06_COTGO|nr:growth/differentiation factor 15 [Cottoperca gobio]